ncbi:MAG: TonB-dependent receptor [Psychroflexus maritimus]
MKNYLLILMLFVSSIVFAQGTVTGTVVDSETSIPLPGANIEVDGSSDGTTTNFDGDFTIKVSSTTGKIRISFLGFTTRELKFDLTSNSSINLGEIGLKAGSQLEEVVVVGSGVIDLANTRATPVAVSTVTKSTIQQRAVGNVEVPEIIKYTPSTYVSGQTGFGDSQIFMRGFDQTNIATLLNGQPVNGMEDGRVYWSNWAGIADVANAVQVQRGLGASKLAISSVGGTINLIMKSSEREKGGFFRMLGGNDSYMKATASYDTGENENGWSFSFLLDHWQGHRKWAKGTYGQGQTYFLSAGYRPNDDHTFNLLLTGAPQLHGQRWSQSQEVLDADPKFNQHWGYTEDGIESERQNFYHKPVLNFNWDWDIDEKTQLSSVAYASWGRGGGTGPRGNGRIRTADPDGDGPLFGQLDYAAITAQNQQIGVGGDYGAPLGAGYIRRGSMNNHQWYGLVSTLTTDLSESLEFSVGSDIRFYTGDHFRQVIDFYGLSGWGNDRPDGAVVTERFDATPWAALFNFADEDERIDYDYSEDINYQGLFSQIEYDKDGLTAYFQGALSNQSYQREGRFDDPGKSEKENKIGYNLKAGSSYAIGKNVKAFTNLGFYSRQPFLDNIFQNIRSSNAIFENPSVDNEEITGLELGFIFENDDKNFRANLNFYYTDWDNRVILNNDIDDNGTPDDPSDDIELNIFDRGVRQLHKGFEFDLQYRPINAVTFTGFISGGNWQFKDSSNVSVYNDETGELVSTENGTDRDGIKVPNAPQFSAGLGIRATPFEGFSLYYNINMYDQLWKNDSNSVQTENVGTLPAYSISDAGFNYDFNISGQSLTFTANVYNLFDNDAIQQTDRFGLIILNGTTFNAALRYNF